MNAHSHQIKSMIVSLFQSAGVLDTHWTLGQSLGLANSRWCQPGRKGSSQRELWFEQGPGLGWEVWWNQWTIPFLPGLYATFPTLPSCGKATALHENFWLNGCRESCKAFQTSNPQEGPLCIKLLRCHQNLTHLYNARQLIKGKVYNGVVSRDPAHAIDLLSGP